MPKEIKIKQEKKEKSDKDAKSKKAAPKTADKQKSFGPECRMLYWDEKNMHLVGSKDNAGTCHHPNKDKDAKGEKGNCATKLSYVHCPNKKAAPKTAPKTESAKS